MIKQGLILLAAAALCSALGDGRGYHSKKSTVKAPSQFASIAEFHSSKPSASDTQRIVQEHETISHPSLSNSHASPYSFGYEAEGSSRQESADANGKVSGSYKVVNEDGSIRLVNYVADENGFRADIDTNEPGTKSDNPADVTLKSAAIEKKYEAPAKKYNPVQSFSQKTVAFEQKPCSASHHGCGQSASFQQQQQVKQYSAPVFQQAPVIQQQVSQFAETKPSPYSFSYDAQLKDGSSSRTESADSNGKVVGQYSLATADGRKRIVKYEADHEGFRASVDSNEFEGDSSSKTQYPSAAPVAPQRFSSTKTANTYVMQQSIPSGIKTFQAPIHQGQSAILYNATFNAIQQPYQHNASPYAFDYAANLDDGSLSRKESSDGNGKVVGSYSLYVADGRQRKVDYVATPEHGFRATVTTNEFGTDPKAESPADIQFYSSASMDEPKSYSSPNAYRPQTRAAAAASMYAQSALAQQPIQFNIKSDQQEAPRHPTGFKAPAFTAQSASAGTYKTSFNNENKVERVQTFQPSPYAFNYQAEASGGSSSRKESSDGNGAVTGSYEVRNEDGSIRVVEYIADKNGFRANVKTNELGTKSDNPADVIFNSNAPIASAVEIEQRPVQTAQFPVRTHASKTNMYTQQKVDDYWSR